MKYLSPRKIPEYPRARSGAVRLTLPRLGHGDVPPGRDVHPLGPARSESSRAEYDRLTKDWVERALALGWAPGGWIPADTGHRGVLSVEELVRAFERHLDRKVGPGWRDSDDPIVGRPGYKA